MENESKKISIKLIVNIILIALIILFMVFNRQHVTIHFLFGQMSIPLFMVIAISAILGWLAGFIIPKFRSKTKK
ncbi:LapA family protein [Listeria aquatica]|uniref:LapA family protein n=1 Tax=Listeria aquatica TaxID=1494960 RepID=A0A841ZTK0_9LIST|nr:LapA family protein [Listeria aquatica]MBC1522250.1 LapA family protein [Listeria aquatica]